MKKNLEISGKKIEIMSERQLVVVLDDFVLKYLRPAINENSKETLRSQHKRLIKRKRGEVKDDQEGGTTFMITTAAAVREVCIVVSTRKARTKHTVSSMIRRKRQITTHDDDLDDNDGVDVDGGDSGKHPESSTLSGPRGPVVHFSWSYLPPPLSLGKICEK